MLNEQDEESILDLSTLGLTTPIFRVHNAYGWILKTLTLGLKISNLYLRIPNSYITMFYFIT